MTEKTLIWMPTPVRMLFTGDRIKSADREENVTGRVVDRNTKTQSVLVAYDDNPERLIAYSYGYGHRSTWLYKEMEVL